MRRLSIFGSGTPCMHVMLCEKLLHTGHLKLLPRQVTDCEAAEYSKSMTTLQVEEDLTRC